MAGKQYVRFICANCGCRTTAIYCRRGCPRCVQLEPCAADDPNRIRWYAWLNYSTGSA